jgi:hypothetical protein
MDKQTPVMFRHQKKYRKLLGAVTLLFYAVGSFQVPVLECLHLLSHLGSLGAHPVEAHSFHAHSSGHSHEVLDLVKNTSGGGDPAPISQNTDIKIKKLTQYCPQNLPSVAIFQTKYIPIFFSPILKTMAVPSVPSPPPQA